MKKPRLFAALALSALLLTACASGGSDSSAALQQENEDLQQKLAALQAENDSLSQENADLRAENAALDDTAPVSGDEEANPIDRYFDAVDSGSTTVEMDLVAGAWADAWEAECRNAASWLQDQLPLQEDKALVDAYLAGVEEQLARIDIMAIYPISDLTVPQSDRVLSSGTLRGVLWAGSRQQLWKDTFYQLLYVAPDYPGSIDSAVGYTFLFDADAMTAYLSAARQG